MLNFNKKVLKRSFRCLYKWPARAGERENRPDKDQAAEARRFPSGPGQGIDFSALGEILPAVDPREKTDKEVTVILDRYPDWKILDAQIRGYELEEPLIISIVPLKPERDAMTADAQG